MGYTFPRFANRFNEGSALQPVTNPPPASPGRSWVQAVPRNSSAMPDLSNDQENASFQPLNTRLPTADLSFLNCSSRKKNGSGCFESSLKLVKLLKPAEHLQQVSGFLSLKCISQIAASLQPGLMTPLWQSLTTVS